MKVNAKILMNHYNLINGCKGKGKYLKNYNIE